MEDPDIGGLNIDVDTDLEISINNPTNNKFNPALCLVGRFLTKKPFRVYIMKEKLSNILAATSRSHDHGIPTGTFLFQFFHQLDI